MKKTATLRAAKVVGGFGLLVAGIAMLALPGPGWIAIFAGLTLLATEFDWARRLLDRLKRVARLEPEPLGQLTQRRLDLAGLERIDLRERLGGGGHHLTVDRALGLDAREEEPGELGELAQPRDLLLHERSDLPHELFVPLEALLA